jgi:hypothetical protein
MFAHERQRIIKMLAEMTPEQVLTLRDEGVAKAQREEERRKAAEMSDPIGTVRLYTGLGDEAFLVRVSDEECWGITDEGQRPDWAVFHDYKTENIPDEYIRRDELSEPVTTLSLAQLKILGLADQ